MKLFEYAVIYVPNEKAVKEGAKASILVPPTTTIAADANSVNMLAVRKIPDEFESKLDQVQVAVRPF